jgi:hypothetical protein
MSGNETVLGASYTSTDDDFRQDTKNKRLSKKRPKTPGSTPPRANKLQSMSASSPAGPSTSAASANPSPMDSTSLGPPSQRPPPIFVPDVKNIEELRQTLKSLVGANLFSFRHTRNETIIYAANAETYRTIVHKLRSSDIPFHCYQLKEEKSLRVVVRGLHHTSSIEEIKSEIKEHGFEVRNIVNVLHPVTKSPLPLFFVDLSPQDNIKDIFKIDVLYNSRVRIEEPYKKNVIPQCQRCQAYGHTRRYCNYTARCVRCGGSHESSTCSKTRETAATCALCQGPHPANYKGCLVYKRLHLARYPGSQQLPAPPAHPKPANQPPVWGITPLEVDHPSTSAPASQDPVAQPTAPQPTVLQPFSEVQTRRHRRRQKQPGVQAQPEGAKPSHHKKEVSAVTVPPARSLGNKSYAHVVVGQIAPPQPIPVPSCPTHTSAQADTLSQSLSTFLSKFETLSSQLILALSTLVTQLLSRMP